MRLLFLLFMSALLAPVAAKASGCLLSQEEKLKITQLAEKIPDISYSSQGFAAHDSFLSNLHRNDERRNFGAKIRVEGLLDAKGNFFLFRDIAGPYERGFTGSHENYIENEGRAYSYSLSPEIAHTWSNPTKSAVTLISWQNIAQKLTYPLLPPHGRGEFTRVKDTLHPQLERKTLVKDIAYYDEVKVPVEDENVLAIVPQKEFIKILDQFRDKPYKLRDLLKSLLDSPTLLSPTCADIDSHEVVSEPDTSVRAQ